jgi:hypothetical protein
MVDPSSQVARGVDQGAVEIEADNAKGERVHARRMAPRYGIRNDLLAWPCP